MKRFNIILAELTSATVMLAVSCGYSQQTTPKYPSAEVTYHEKYRPQYHLTPPRGPLFDPTALVYVDGEYQVNKGIALSKDLVHWKLGRAQSLSTDSVAEMSGSALIDSFNTSGFGVNGEPPMVAIYSGLRRKDGRQFQNIAYSTDSGKTWTNYKGNPVIDINSTEFRDPQVFWFAPEKKWVMVVALAAERKIRFYSSANLKEWQFLSDFGPFGAVNGVWECPDFFPLQVRDSTGVSKWVLEVSVQPIGGQYFIGDFDGRAFTADAEFMKTSGIELPEGKVIFDFEEGLADWKKEGGAFSASPASGPLPYQNAVLGYAGRHLINSFYPGDKGTGKLTSPEFLIDRPFLNFLIGGGLHPSTACVNLIIDNKVVRTQTGTETEALYWTGWDVSSWKGRKARLEIVDNETGPFGHIMIDHVMLADKLARKSRENAFWLDYGPDFYAVRSWVNGPAQDNRRISVAWLGSWLYATKVPSMPWKGGHTFPRELKLVNTSEGFRIRQNLVREIEILRRDAIHRENLQVSNRSTMLDQRIPANVYEMVAEIELPENGKFELGLCGKKENKTIVSYNADEGILSVDRSKSGDVSFSPSFPGFYSAPVKLKSGLLKLHILIDQSSIEVFANDGEANLTCQLFPGSDATEISWRAPTGKVKIQKLTIWPLNGIWQNEE
ncbi:glycoside hydrolase family 32 protein [Pararcticibacter amylolyticus]|uniref:Glycosyl hydrolase family 32 n=1 Tax=Pararcticibacter amylolyticus TaxID=2173175 RepID=A0A2U2PDB4_9SPHI|nr:glycoside hydrolase family 32 protein [Pararcticibacter amylolyticus]PWG79304.1 hypothetical protein DDR33_17430 [Pararcticibacter amylolyticus]